MIDALIIDDLGVIEHAELELGDGLNVLTGETGAGKTMIVTALGLIRGERAEARLIRERAKSARVQGIWDAWPTHIPQPDDDADEVDDGLIIQRTLSSNGKSRAQMNGRVVPASTLRTFTEPLITVHGQSEQLTLKLPARQLVMLDEAGALTELRDAYRTAYENWQALLAEFEELKRTSDARTTEAARLREQVELVESLQPEIGEEQRLRAAIERQSHLASITEQLQLAHQLINGDDAPAAAALAEDAGRAVDNAAAYDERLRPLVERIQGLAYELNDAGGELASALENAGDSAGDELEALQERLGSIQRLERLLGVEADGLPTFVSTSSDRLLTLDTAHARLDAMADEVDTARANAEALANDLHEQRTKIAAEVSQSVTQELHELAMSGAEFTIEVTPDDTLHETGRDNVVFLLRANSGATPQPLAKTASGGELSRVMLAVELVMAQQQSDVTYIFDEVDAGVGGASAVEIGRRLAQLGQRHQVLVVTHLPQVAAYADRHIVIEKVDTGTWTTSDVRTVTGDTRVAELARMLAGSESATALAHARELLQRSGKVLES